MSPNRMINKALKCKTHDLENHNNQFKMYQDTYDVLKKDLNTKKSTPDVFQLIDPKDFNNINHFKNIQDTFIDSKLSDKKEMLKRYEYILEGKGLFYDDLGSKTTPVLHDNDIDFLLRYKADLKGYLNLKSTKKLINLNYKHFKFDTIQRKHLKTDTIMEGIQITNPDLTIDILINLIGYYVLKSSRYHKPLLLSYHYSESQDMKNVGSIMLHEPLNTLSDREINDFMSDVWFKVHIEDYKAQYYNHSMNYELLDSSMAQAYKLQNKYYLNKLDTVITMDKHERFDIIIDIIDDINMLYFNIHNDREGYEFGIKGTY